MLQHRSLHQLLAAALLLAACACGSPTTPSSPLTLALTASVTGRIIVCTTCTMPPEQWIVAEFPVTLSDPRGPGGTLQSIETRVFNRTRGRTELGRNARPNADYQYADLAVPAGGSLTLPAGIVFHPLPPPRDELVVEVVATLTDGRSARQEGLLLATLGD
jgi:hypothetical protein